MESVTGLFIYSMSNVSYGDLNQQSKTETKKEDPLALCLHINKFPGLRESI